MTKSDSEAYQGTDGEALTDENAHLIDEAVRALEAVDWRQVETVSAETAAVFTSRLIDAGGQADAA